MSEFSRITDAVRAGLESDTQHGAVVPPLHLSSNFTFAGFGEPRKYDYTRSGNPTRDQLGCAISDLEGGAGGIVTATGMGAITVVLHALLSPGQRLIAPHDCYGGTWRLLDSLARKGSFTVDLVDFTDPAALDAALAAEPAPAVVWIESPSNPLLRITDIEDVARRGHAVGATVVADNTFLSPLLQQPLALGCDVVVHSTTKYLNGHSDVVGGAVISATPELHEQMAFWSNTIGITGSPFDAYLTLRGLRTLAPRLRAHQEAAEAVVAALVAHPAVARVNYPGLPNHPGHATAARQQSGFGAMLSFEVRGGTPAVRALLERLRLFSLAESLGGVESLVAHPATMTHASMSAEARTVAGIGDGLLRLSIGIEDPRDLVADLTAALDAAGAAG
ncbi:cystathionine gamma-synthase [Cumulibacter manganitolerans]|uniref:cystathionine gamma-synthase n=1 Tax=Cumulibacter manganitolerans TaxID=1884992 RepID=UPI0012954FBC|nr:cystathionine gamma-synthase [Cumulibacter manganitolerans]